MTCFHNIICEDNLVALKKLPANYANLVYIDPPFFTNAIQSSHDNTYNDCWDSIEHYIAWMRPRIEELLRVMKDDGTIYLHCDHHANAHLRILCDSIFKPENLIREIIYNTSSNISGYKSKSRYWVKQHETIFMYKKDKDPVFHKQYREWNEAELEKFDKEEDDRRYKSYMKNGKEIRQYLDLCPGIPIGDIWNDIKTFQFSSIARTESVKYPTQKPLGLMKRIISASSDEGDIILDAFCGSGTTIVAAKMLGRSGIGIDASENACKISEERLSIITNNLTEFFD
jgi:site-specific DNA-methyltransferase (adenine-specific)